MEIDKNAAGIPETIADLIPILENNFEWILEDENININDCTMNQYNYIMRKLNRLVIEPNKQLFYENYTNTNSDNTILKRYNADSIIYIYNNFYLDITLQYNKKVTLKSFVYLIGVSNGYIYQLHKDERLNTVKKLLIQKVREDSEESIISLMDSEKSALPYITELNSRYGWNVSGGMQTENEQTNTISLDTARSSFELFQNSTQFLEDKNG